MKSKKNDAQCNPGPYILRNKFSVLIPNQTKDSMQKKKVAFNTPKDSPSPSMDPLVFFEDWPSPELFEFNTSVLESKFVDNFFEDHDLRLLFNHEITQINWRRPSEFIPYGLVLHEIIKRKNMTVSPKFIVDFINAPSSTRKSYSNKLAQSENQEINNFLTENALTLTRLLKSEHSCFIVDSILRTESKADYESKQTSSFVQILKEVPIEIGTNHNPPVGVPTKKKNVNFKMSINQEDLGFVLKPTKYQVIEFLPSNLNNKTWSCNFTLWVSSLFQFIKDMKLRDVFDNSCVWSKIYPQDSDGIPIINPSGKYWVKLYFCGKSKKIEIDDQMPCTEFEEFLFPRCTKLEEIWPCILTKALIKLYFFKINKKSYIIDKIGDGSFLYSLLGYSTEKLDMESNYSYITLMMSTLYESNLFSSRQKFAMCFNSKQTFENLNHKLINSDSGLSCSLDEDKEKTRPARSSKQRLTAGNCNSSPIKLRTQLSIKQNLIKLNACKMEKNIYQQDVESKILEEDEAIQETTKYKTGNLRLIKKMNNENKRLQLTILKLNKRSSMFLPNLKSSFHSSRDNVYVLGKALASFGYSIFDYFHSNDFNMDRLNSLDFTDINEMSIIPEIPFKQMTKDEKRKYLYDLVALKNRQKELRLNRIEGLLKAGQLKNFIKIGSESLGLNELNNYGEFKFSSMQIEIAKVCVKSKCKLPPLAYYESLLDNNEDEEDMDIDDNNPLNRANNVADIEALINNENYSPAIKEKKRLQPTTPSARKNSNLILLLSGTNDSVQDYSAPNVHDSGVLPKLMKTTTSSKKTLGLTKRTSMLGKNNTMTSTLNLNEISELYTTHIARTRSQIKFIYSMMLQLSACNLSSKSIQRIYQETAMTQKISVLGEWIDFSKFIIIFDKVLLIHNISFYPHHYKLDQSLFALKASRKEFEKKPAEQSLINKAGFKRRVSKIENQKELFKREEEEGEEIFNLDKSRSVFRLIGDKESQGRSSVLIQYESYSGDLNDINPLLNINIASRNDPKFCVTHTFKNYFDAYEYSSLMINEEYFIIIESCFCPFGFVLTLHSNHSITNISYCQYLREHKVYKSFSRNIEVPEISRGSYFVLMKFNIALEESRSTKHRTNQNGKAIGSSKDLLNPKDSLSSHLNNSNDSVKHFQSKDKENQYHNYFTEEHKDEKSTQEELLERLDEGLLIHFSLPDSSLLINEYVDIYLTTNSISKGEKNEEDITLVKLLNYEMFDINDYCNVCISIKCPYSIQKQTALFEILGNIEYNIEFMDVIESFEIQDKSYLVKNFTVFKERVAVNTSVNLTLQLKFYDSNRNDLENLDFSKDHFTTLCNEYTQMSESNILFRLELMSDEQTLRVWQFKNEITLQNIYLPCPSEMTYQHQISDHHAAGLDKKNLRQTTMVQSPLKSFYLRCSVFCLDEIMFYEIKPRMTATFWVIKLFATNPICLFKDVTKFELEAKEINSWKLNQPDRPIKAKASRINFLNEIKSTPENDMTLEKHTLSIEHFGNILKTDYPDKISGNTISYSKFNLRLSGKQDHEISAFTPTNKCAFVKNFVHTTSHSKEQIEVSNFMSDRSIHKTHLYQDSNYTLANPLLLMTDSSTLPAIYRPSYISNSKFETILDPFNSPKNGGNDILKKISIVSQNTTKHLLGDIQNNNQINYSTQVNDKHTNQLSFRNVRHHDPGSKRNLTAVDQQYIANSMAKVVSGSIVAENKIKEENHRFEAEVVLRKSRIESFYKSFFKSRVDTRYKVNELITSRMSISEAHTDIITKFKNLSQFIQKLKDDCLSASAGILNIENAKNTENSKFLIRQLTLTNTIVVCAPLTSLRELLVSFNDFKQSLKSNLISDELWQEYQLKVSNINDYIMECFHNLIKCLFSRLRDLENFKDHRKDKSKEVHEIKDDLVSILELIGRYQIQINPSVWDQMNNLVSTNY